MRYWLVALALWAGAYSTAWALPETPQFRKVGVAEGLPSSFLNGLAVDRDGYLWIATRDGLARYDGVGYKIYQHVPGDAGALPGNMVQTVFVDSRNRVWVGVEGQGFCVLDPARKRFRRFHMGNRHELLSNDVLAIQQTSDASLWFGTYGGGLYRMDARERLTRYLPIAKDPHSLPDANVLSLLTDGRGQLWVGTSAGLARWTGRDFERIPAQQLSGETILSLSADSDGSLWAGSDGGLDHILATGRVVRPAWRDDLPDRGVSGVLRDREGTLWITTRRGMARERAGKVEDLALRLDGNPVVLQALEDREGGLWFATMSEGLLRLPAGWRHFAAFGKLPGGQGLSGLPIRGSAPARDGRVWLVGMSGVVDKLDPITGEVEHVLDTSAELPEGRFRSVLEASDGGLWLGHRRGLTRYDPRTHRYRHWHSGEGDEDLPAAAVHLLAENEGMIWLSTYGGGVQARDLSGHRLYSFTPKDGRGVDSAEQAQMSTGPDGAIWLAGPSGLRRWSAARERFESIPGAPAAHIYGFTSVPPDTLWLHRLGSLEAYRWDGRSLSRFRSVGADTGMPAVESGGLLADRNGALWLTTSRGLWRYDPVGDRLRMFGVRDGLPSQEFLAQPFMLLPQGLGLASTTAGVLLFDPARIHGNGEPPRLTLDNLSLRRDEDVVSLAPGPDGLVMGPEDRDLHVGARLLSFSDPAAHRYRFWLHGYDADWVSVGAKGDRDFSRLEPGDYRMEIAASNADAVWSGPLELRLRVLAPWWQRPYALAAWALLASGLLVLSARALRQYWRRRSAEQMREQRRELSDQGSEAKSRFLAMLGHEIRTPMTGVLGMAELLQGSDLAPRQRQQVDAIQRAGEHLLRLVNDALDLARIESGKLTLEDKPFDLHALLDEVSALLQPLAQAKGLQFSLQRAPGTPRVLRGDGGRVRQVLLNLGSNAIKFTDRGEVALRSASTPKGLLLEINDTGPGMEPEQVAKLFQRFEQGTRLQGSKRQAGSGLGLAICQELALAMGGQIDVQSAPGQGTSFRVRLPMPVAQIEDLLPPEARRPPRKANALRILVVEDDPTIADVVTGLLESLGHEVVHAAQALAAVTELSQSRFDLAFLDLDLPGVDGLVLARIIRSQGHTLALVALTARSDPTAESLSYAAGMHGFLRKPVTRQILQDKIEQMMALVRANPSGKQATRP